MSSCPINSTKQPEAKSVPVIVNVWNWPEEGSCSWTGDIEVISGGCWLIGTHEPVLALEY